MIFAEINEDTINYHKKFYTRFLIKSILTHAKIILVPGSNTKKYWENERFYHKTLILHSTIDTDIYNPDNKSLKLYDFIYIGEFDYNKRPDLILDSFSEIVKSGYVVTLCLIGFGVLEKTLMEKIKRDKLQDFVTVIKSNNVLKYIQQSKIFIMAYYFQKVFHVGYLKRCLAN